MLISFSNVIVCRVNKKDKNDFSAMQSQKTVYADFTSKQILPFGFTEQNCREILGCSVVQGLIYTLQTLDM